MGIGSTTLVEEVASMCCSSPTGFSEGPRVFTDEKLWLNIASKRFPFKLQLDLPPNPHPFLDLFLSFLN